MHFHLTVNGDGAAFEDEPPSELGRILRDVAAQIESGVLPPPERAPVRDLNGNTCGTWTLA